MIRALAIVCALGALLSLTSFAQDAGGGGDRGGRRGEFNREEFQARMNERLKESLGSTDEEWQVVQPLLTTVMEKQRAVRELTSFGRGGWGGRRGGEGDQQQQQQQREQPVPVAELQAAIDANDATAITQKLAALREARSVRETELKEARAALVEVLTAKQEASLVLSGMLE